MSHLFIPHDYQDEALQHLYERRRCGLWMPMGGGKTVVTLTALDNLSLVEDVFHALVLAPKRVAQSVWPVETKKWAHLQHLRCSTILGDVRERRAALRQPADIYTMNYDNLVWLVEELNGKWPFRTVVADECFVAGTLIDTPDGRRPIEDIGIGDFVKTHAGPRRVAHTQSRLTSILNLVSLKTSDGGEIVTTKNHPFFTDAGWLPARACGGRKLYSANDLSDLSRDLQQGTHASTRASPETEDTILLARLPHEGDVSLQRGQPRDEPGNHGGLEQGQNLLLELWASMVRRPSGEDVGGAEGPNSVTFSGWERNRDVAYGGVDSAAHAGRFYLELHRSVGRLWARLSLALQAGLREHQNKSMLGGRWSIPSYKTGTRARREEERETTVLRVESLPNNKRRGLVSVFNIEVEGAPTYFAAGYLVHNCTRLKGFRLRQGSKRARALGKVVHAKGSRFIGLTGTPNPNGLKDLWGQLWFVDKGQRLGRTFSAFQDRWFRIGYDGYSIEPLPHAQAEIEGLVRDVCLTVRGLPVDEPIVNDIYVDLPPKARRIYKDMWDDLVAIIRANEVEAANAAVRSGKCLQLANGSIYTDDEGNWESVHDAKLEALDSVIEEANGASVLIAYNFKSDLARLQKRYPDAKVLDTNTRTIDQWNAGRISKLLAHPASAGHGLNLAEGGNIIAFFGLNWSLELYQQIIERIGPLRQKQAGLDRPVFVHRIIARRTVDDIVIERLGTNRSVQELMLEACRRAR